MGNLDIYNALRSVPECAIKPIQGGKLKGKSDINPVWRIKALTEQFGACGIGWKYEVVRFWTEPGAGGEVAAFAQINLYIMGEADWSEPIPGIGGSMLIATERDKLATSDECYKMALTDAISVSCKALGVAADVYWEKDKTKYTQPPAPPKEPSRPTSPPPPTTLSEPALCPSCGKMSAKGGKTTTPAEFIAKAGMCPDCYNAAKKAAAEREKDAAQAQAS